MTLRSTRARTRASHRAVHRFVGGAPRGRRLLLYVAPVLRERGPVFDARQVSRRIQGIPGDAAGLGQGRYDRADEDRQRERAAVCVRHESLAAMDSGRATRRGASE